MTAFMTGFVGFFNVGPRPAHRALKGLFIAAFNIAVFTLLDWLLPGWTGNSTFAWTFGVGIFCGYFFWGNKS